MPQERFSMKELIARYSDFTVERREEGILLLSQDHLIEGQRLVMTREDYEEIGRLMGWRER
jgi:hypothetical protein